jgi:hypothetical protein
MANWLGGLQGLLGGAGAGAGIGSMVPGATGVTAAIGAGIGGLGGGLAGLFGGGKEGGVQQAQIFNPQQQQILQFLLQQGQQGLQNPSAGFAPIAQQARSQFNQQTVPSLAERFTSMGQNSLGSPAFASQLGQAGSGLEEALAALQSQYGMQNQQNALQMLALGMSPGFENFYQGSQPGLGENILSGAAQAAPSFYQSYMLNNALRKLQG